MVLRIILTYAIMHSTAASRRHSPSKDNGGRPESCGTGRNQAPSVKRGNLHPHAVGGLSERRMRAMRIRRSFFHGLRLSGGLLNRLDGGSKPQQPVGEFLFGDGERRQKTQAVLGGEDDESVFEGLRLDVGGLAAFD